MRSRFHSRLAKRASLPALALSTLLITSSAHAAAVTASSYFGGTGDDTLTGVAIGSDGAVFIAGTSSSSSLGGSGAKQLGTGGGFVAKLDATATRVLWFSWIEPPGHLYLSPRDEPIVASGSHLLELAADGSSLAWTGKDLASAITDLNVAATGDIGVIAGRAAWVFAGDGQTAKIAVNDVGRDHVSGVAVDPKTGNLYVSGDTNAGYGSCGGPWRSPFIFSFDAAGQRVAKLFDFSGQQACDQGLAADSFFTGLAFDASGALWVTGGADGGNTVLSRAGSDVTKTSNALQGACFSSACYGWKGAAKPGFFGRLSSNVTDFERASFVVSHFNLAPAGCSCDVKQDDGSGARPNSAVFDWVFPTSTGDVVAVGNAAWHFPTVAAWYSQAAYTGYNAVAAVFDSALSAMKVATILPGAGSPGQAAYRGGKLAVVGGARDNSAWQPPAGQEMLNQASVPATPPGAALQPKFGGGASDGYVFLACLTTESECGAPPIQSPTSTGMGGAPGGTAGAPTGNAGAGGDRAATGGQAGSNSTSSGGAPGAGANATSKNDAGCGCVLARTANPSVGSWLAAFLVSALALRRRPLTRPRRS